MGIEKSVVSEQAQRDMEERAKQRAANRRAGGPGVLGGNDDIDDKKGTVFGGVDLSQITTDLARGDTDDNLPSMFFEPESVMSEEEMMEADPVGTMSVVDQLKDTVDSATWPTPQSAVKDVLILISTVLLTTTLVLGWDGFLREAYTDIGIIPRQEETVNAIDQGLKVPESWTNNMSEEDLLNFQESQATSSPSAGSSQSSNSATNGFPDL